MGISLWLLLAAPWLLAKLSFFLLLFVLLCLSSMNFLSIYFAFFLLDDEVSVYQVIKLYFIFKLLTFIITGQLIPLNVLCILKMIKSSFSLNY